MSEDTKATAIAPSNIAFIKYWGNADSRLNIPFNNSIYKCPLLDGEIIFFFDEFEVWFFV